jgi:prepilin-type N-terminal cleavage/methylation domain-containing protein
MKTYKKRKGFTLIELAIVIAILGILALYALPKYEGMVKEAKISACKANLGALRSALGIAYVKIELCGGSGTYGTHYPYCSHLNENLYDPYQKGSNDYHSSRAVHLMENAIPPNPFDTDGDPNNIICASSKMSHSDAENRRMLYENDSDPSKHGGWIYYVRKGSWGTTIVIYPNTDTDDIHENHF